MLSRTYKLSLLSAIALLCQNVVPSYAETVVAPKITDPHFQFAKGYLQSSELPDSLLLLGPPPAKDSAAQARDEEARTSTIPLRGTARGELARQDADLVFPQPAKNYSCAMGFEISEKKTPHIYRLMQRVLTDAGMSTYGVKNKFHRIRPFVVHNEGTCTPDDEAVLRDDGSYPSGHTAAGWAWALTLAELNPARSNELYARGVAFGQSRVICNAHWQSDVDGGRIMGAATVSKLHSNPDFLAEMKKAKAEVKAMKASSSKLNCAAEDAALSQ